MAEKKIIGEEPEENLSTELSVEETEFQELLNSPEVQKFISNPYFLNRITVQPTRTLSITLSRDTGSIHTFQAWVNDVMVMNKAGEWKNTVFGIPTKVQIVVVGIGNSTFKLRINERPTATITLKKGCYNEIFNL